VRWTDVAQQVQHEMQIASRERCAAEGEATSKYGNSPIALLVGEPWLAALTARTDLVAVRVIWWRYSMRGSEFAVGARPRTMSQSEIPKIGQTPILLE